MPKVIIKITLFETFADAASHSSINVLLSLAASLLSSVDIKTAFLYSPIKELLYLHLPHGLEPNIMPSIVRSINASMVFDKLPLNGVLFLTPTSNTWVLSSYGQTVYIINHSFNNVSERLILGVNVDDILCLGTTMGIASWFHKELSIYFSITINLKISCRECKLITT